MQKKDTVVFDLDGTLLDTLDDLMNSVNYALESNGYPARTKDEVRRFVGNDYRFLLPCAALAGAVLMLWADIASRVVIPPTVLPIGAITSFLGAPVFLYILFQGGRRP